MEKLLTHVGVAMLVAACSTAYLARHVSPVVDVDPAGHSVGVVVTDGDGHFVVTLGPVPLILTADFIPG